MTVREKGSMGRGQFRKKLFFCCGFHYGLTQANRLLAIGLQTHMICGTHYLNLEWRGHRLRHMLCAA